MVALACETPAERALVPAFVFFFQLLYPFAWVNDPLRATAAAAGGTHPDPPPGLAAHRRDRGVRGRADRRCGAGGRGEARRPHLAGPLRPGALGAALSGRSRHLAHGRAHRLCAAALSRRCCCSERCSAMALTLLVPPLAALFGHGMARWFGWLAWGAMAAVVPTDAAPVSSLAAVGAIPAAVAAFYLAATIGSAVNHHLGRGVAWKGRAYQGAGA